MSKSSPRRGGWLPKPATQGQATYHSAKVQGGILLQFSPPKLPRQAIKSNNQLLENHPMSSPNWWSLSIDQLSIDDSQLLSLTIVGWLVNCCSWLDSSIYWIYGNSEIAFVMIKRKHGKKVTKITKLIENIRKYSNTSAHRKWEPWILWTPGLVRTHLPPPDADRARRDSARASPGRLIELTLW